VRADLSTRLQNASGVLFGILSNTRELVVKQTLFYLMLPSFVFCRFIPDRIWICQDSHPCDLFYSHMGGQEVSSALLSR
jgi:hypothetical protein